MTLTTVTPAFVDDFGVINATALNTWRTELTDALDGIAGGGYAPAAPINVTGSGFGAVEVNTLSEVALGGQRVIAVGSAISDADNQTIEIAGGQLRAFATPGANRVHDLSATDATEGSWLQVLRGAAGAFTIKINRSGFVGNNIVTLPAGTWASATLYYRNTTWRLLKHSAATPGADA